MELIPFSAEFSFYLQADRERKRAKAGVAGEN